MSDPAVDSHHDLIVSNWSLPDLPPQEPSDDNVVAPRVPNTRSKVLWSDSGVENFQQYVVPELERIQQLWLTSSEISKSSLSLLLEATNNILLTGAKH